MRVEGRRSVVRARRGRLFGQLVASDQLARAVRAQMISCLSDGGRLFFGRWRRGGRPWRSEKRGGPLVCERTSCERRLLCFAARGVACGGVGWDGPKVCGIDSCLRPGGMSGWTNADVLAEARLRGDGWGGANNCSQINETSADLLSARPTISPPSLLSAPTAY